MIHRFLALVAVLFAAAGTLVACSSSGGNPAPTSPATSTSKTSASKSKAPPSIPSQHALPNPSKISNSVKLRRQVAITKCVSTADGWKASGNAVNTGSKKRFRAKITVFFTTTQATVLDYAQTHVNVAPGKTESWTAAAKFTAARNMRCVLRGVG